MVKSWTNLCIPRVCVEYIAKELACHGHASDNQTMDVVRVDYKRFAAQLGGKFRHSVKVYEERKEHLVRGGAIFEDSKEIGFEGDSGDIPSVER